MQLSEQTVNVLSNFSSIQDNLKVNEGSAIMTMSEARNIVACAQLEQEFPKEFGIYDLKEFLSALSLAPDATLTFGDKHMHITDGVGKTKIKYVYADSSILTYPPKAPNVTDADIDVRFDIDQETINQLKKASAVFGYDNMTISPSGDNVKLSIVDPDDKTSNSYAVELPGSIPSENFNFIIDINLLKLIPGNYKVEVSRKLLSKFTIESGSIVYYIALNKSSTFGE